jgi:hypothetical protein
VSKNWEKYPTLVLKGRELHAEQDANMAVELKLKNFKLLFCIFFRGLLTQEIVFTF